MLSRFLLVPAAALLLLAPFLTPASAQHVRDPHASLLNVRARQAQLMQTKDPRLQEAIHNLPSCSALEPVPPPDAPIEIPHHYLHGSSGPINPAEKEATAPFSHFEQRFTAGMNRWLATADAGEARCALDQLDSWAQAGALLEYDPHAFSQSWFQVGWTLCSAGITMSVLNEDPGLNADEKKRVLDWLHQATTRLVSFDKPTGNNLHYWRALAATSVGIMTRDDKLFQFGVSTYRNAIAEIDSNGALPLEMQRHENAIHYQGFALAPLTLIAEFATRQGVNLYAFQSHGRTLRDAIVFYGRATEDPSLVKTYTSDTQNAKFGPGDFAAFNFFLARFGTKGVPPRLLEAQNADAASVWLGGNTLLLAPAAR